MSKEQVEFFLENFLQDDDLESLFEYFNLEVPDVIWHLYRQGLIDEDLIK